jgi:hypothetical protein
VEVRHLARHDPGPGGPAQRNLGHPLVS